MSRRTDTRSSVISWKSFVASAACSGDYAKVDNDILNPIRRSDSTAFVCNPNPDNKQQELVNEPEICASIKPSSSGILQSYATNLVLQGRSTLQWSFAKTAHVVRPAFLCECWYIQYIAHPKVISYLRSININ